MDDYGPNSLQQYADDMVSCTQLQAVYTVDGLISAWMPCSNGDWPNWQQTMRSQHIGGVYAALGDGSVQWVSDLINSTPSTYASLSVWDCLIASGDGVSIAADVLEQ
jgi:hypothetical protein